MLLDPETRIGENSEDGVADINSGDKAVYTTLGLTLPKTRLFGLLCADIQSVFEKLSIMSSVPRKYGFISRLHWKVFCIAALGALLAYFPIFLNLSIPPVRLWDEARVVLSANEMAENGNLIVVHYNGAPDMLSLKPPLMLWLQAISIQLLGLNEFSVRLPAAIAAVLTCVLLFVFSLCYLRNAMFGLLAVLILVTSTGYIHEHVARTGDYDSLLILCTTAYLLFFFIYLEDATGKGRKYLLYFFLALTLGILCKGVQAMLFLPAVLLYVLVRWKIVDIFREKYFYLGLFVVVVIGGGYYLLRESLNPGYLKAVWESELGGRFNTVIEGHEGPFTYYWDLLVLQHISHWYLFVPCGIGVGLLHRERRIRNLTLLLSLSCLIYFLLVSKAQTKLFWYDGPLIPLLAVIISVFLAWLFDLAGSVEKQVNKLRLTVSPALLTFLFFLKPYTEVIDKVSNYQEIDKPFAYHIPNYLRGGLDGKRNLDRCKIVSFVPPQSDQFYINMLSEKGQKVSFGRLNDLLPGDCVIVSDWGVRNFVEANFHASVEESMDNTVFRLKLLSRKRR